MKKRKDEKAKRSRYEAIRCKFENMGQQCRLIGDIIPGAGEGSHFYCSFHMKVITTSGEMNTFKQFINWRDTYIESNPEEIYGSPRHDKSGEVEEIYVSQFHKYETNQLWQMMGNGI